MFWSILHRTIFLELLKVFGLALVALTGILVMAGIVAEATQQGLGPSQVLAVIPLLIPSTMPYTIPTTTLFATCVVYGRLAHDNEILAIRAAGINILKVVWPAFLLGIIMSVATMGLYYYLIPTTHHLLRSRIFNEVEEYLYTMLRKDRCIKQPGLNYVMFVRHVQGTHLQDALFKRQDGHGHYDIIARAREAELRFDQSNHQMLVKMRHCEVNNDTGTAHSYFEERVWEVPLPPDFGNTRKPRPRALTWPQLLEERQRLIGEQQEYDARVAAVTDAAELHQHRTNLKNERRRCHLELCNVETELHMRPALSGGCLCFVLIGCPVGIWFSRSDYLSAFITCFLPVVFVYYPVLLCGTSYAKSGQLPALAALWISNTLMAVAAVFLFRKLLRN